MPVYFSGFLIPTSKSIPFLMEDVYLRGGYRCVSTLEERNALKSSARKTGCLVYVAETSKIYQILGSVAGDDAWTVFDITEYVNFNWANPLSMAVNEETGERTVSIDEGRLVPETPQLEEGELYALAFDGVQLTWVNASGIGSGGSGGSGGGSLPEAPANPENYSLVLDAAGEPYWSKIVPGITIGDTVGNVLTIDNDRTAQWKPSYAPARTTQTLSLTSLAAGGTKDLTFDIQSTTIMMLGVSLDIPSIEVALHSTPDFVDVNPFVFVSSEAKLSDDGMEYDEEGNPTAHRRYGFYSDGSNSKKMYVRVTNNGEEVASPTLTLQYIPMEQ